MTPLGQQRRHSRERALEILYESSMKERPVSVILTELASRPDEYTVALVTSTEEHRDEAERLISEYSVDWPLERLALVDRLIMTLAVGEMRLGDPPPIAVILDEAVELAKTYSTESSSSFVNGVLSSIARRILE